MLLYILKSGACLAILLLFYKFLLEREGCHSFKRFFLLASLVSSLLIPLITFKEYIDINDTASPFIMESVDSGHDIIAEETINPMPVFLWSIYIIGVLVFYIRFSIRIKGIIERINQNQLYHHSAYTNVLLNEKITPHTFLKYIFLNKKAYEQQEIPKEVLIHEEAHARQHHSYDIIFLEVLQIVMWFNPLIYFTKQLVRLNHEFLADREVLKQGVHSSLYQETILAFSSNTRYSNLSSAINYSSIKKRFTVMKTQTSRFTRLKSALLLPLLAVLIYSFSEKEIMMKHNQTEVIVLKMPNNNEVEFQESTFTLKAIEKELSSYIEREEVHIEYGPEVTVEACNSLHNLLIKLGFPIIKEYAIGTNGILMKDFYSHTLKVNTPEDALLQYNSLAKHYNTFKLDKGMDLIDISKIQYLYEKLTPHQKKSAEPYPDLSSFKNSKQLLITIQQGATKKMVDEYNKLAEKYKHSNLGKVRIDKKEVARMHHIYGLMTKQQKAKAKPYPSFPPPPPPAPKHKQVKEEVIEIIEEPVPPPTPKEPVVIEVIEERIEEPKEEIIEVIETEEVITGNGTKKVTENKGMPTPPPPPDPVEHFRELEKQQAKFYYNGKSITAKKAIEIVKTKKATNISVRKESNGVPTVKLTDKPVKN
ncbi:M56 family metallopeptidase [Zhouia spongiae]|uniref:M56 family metallopeptidase n=1 Tax=Zhouia spongiae TaxID=2202721 RepID=A0ABY3YNK3_9FLAO|nr:M56 family metallopeptidase [Zhouia spongiae]UNY99405.1 M56 family metallopeptidase [Zhouia spongiae]